MSSEGLDLDIAIGVCFLIIFSLFALAFGPLGLLFIAFAVLVCLNNIKKKEQLQSSPTSEVERFYPSSSEPRLVKVDRRIIYQVPGKCPECGASLSNEDVDWVGPLQAKCPFCHTTVEAQPVEF